MRRRELLLISFLAIAILTSSSFAATKIQYSSIQPQQISWPTGTNHTFDKFDPALGNLTKVNLAARLDGNLSGLYENANPKNWLNKSYARTNATMDILLNGSKLLTLKIELKIPKDKEYINLSPYTEPMFSGKNDTFSGENVSNDTDYTNPTDLSSYIGLEKLILPCRTNGAIEVKSLEGGANVNSQLRSWGWSNATLTYTYLLNLSGYKKNCTGWPLSGWKIMVNNSTQNWTATTDASGFWQVCNLDNGTYTVCEVPQSGWTQTYPDGCHTVELAGYSKANINFINQELKCISGYKLDACTKTPIPGWNITLNNATHTVSMLTGPDGRYEFCNLKPGPYTLTEENRTGYRAISVVSNPLELNCSNLTNQNFTNSRLFCVSGRKVDDCTGAGLAGWQMTVRNASSGEIVGQNNTIIDGHWIVCDLLPGKYQVTETPQLGWKNLTNLTQNITLGCENESGVDFHNVELFCLGGRKTDYCTGLGLSGWTVIVENVTTGETNTNTTDEAGYWRVCDLVFGDYNVSEVLQSGWMNVTPIIQAVRLPCTSKLDVNFVNRKLYCISGYKLDNCTRVGIPGWEIILSNSSGEVSRTETDPAGYYEFFSLFPGSYTITESPKPGWISKSNVSMDVNLNCSNITDQNFTNQKLLCISGYKLDRCSGPLPGWEITIHNDTEYA
ncbi:MAG: choice-of-anchor E domain-containing protein, partial [Methanothrix sp.]|nr:choice-of-anchor E domain-containing protein [Methanothrix sp.]